MLESSCQRWENNKQLEKPGLGKKNCHYCARLLSNPKPKIIRKTAGKLLLGLWVHSLYIQTREEQLLKKKKNPHIWMLKKQSCSKHAKGRKLFSFHGVGAVFGSIQQGVKLLFNTTSTDILPLPAPRRTYFPHVGPTSLCFFLREGSDIQAHLITFLGPVNRDPTGPWLDVHSAPPP